jgi:hypothetical protein
LEGDVLYVRLKITDSAVIKAVMDIKDISVNTAIVYTTTTMDITTIKTP